MSKARKTNRPAISFDDVKRLTIVAMFADDEFIDQFVLKGGNALDIVHQVSTRASFDVDLSMATDFPPDSLSAVRSRIERALRSTFRLVGFEVFDVRMSETPEAISPDLADFWGGYVVEFKLIAADEYQRFERDIEALRRNALTLGTRGKFTIDLSRHEYTADKLPTDLDGYRIYVYSPAMLVCEKLRAICQQMDEYGPVIRRNRRGAPRAKDYVDIHGIIERFHLRMEDDATLAVLSSVFEAKRVPLSLLEKAPQYREFHRLGFQGVVDTVRPGVRLRAFDFYADEVERLARNMARDLNASSS